MSEADCSDKWVKEIAFDDKGVKGRVKHRSSGSGVIGVAQWSKSNTIRRVGGEIKGNVVAFGDEREQKDYIVWRTDYVNGWDVTAAYAECQGNFQDRGV